MKNAKTRSSLQRPAAAVEREIPSILADGLTPFIAMMLAGGNGTNWPLVAGCVMFGAAISMSPSGWPLKPVKR